MKIFISGPYSAQTEAEREKNALRVVDVAIRLMKKGHVPFIPHLMHWLDKRARELGYELTWEDFMYHDSAWLKDCEAILYLDSSEGADIELHEARKLGLKIYYDETEIPEAA